jgi:hypothetical protein
LLRYRLRSLLVFAYLGRLVLSFNTTSFAFGNPEKFLKIFSPFFRPPKKMGGGSKGEECDVRPIEEITAQTPPF